MICRHATCYVWRRAVTPRAECSASIPRAVHGKHDSAASMRVTAGKHDSAAGRAGFYRPFKDPLQGLLKVLQQAGKPQWPHKAFYRLFKDLLKGLIIGGDKLVGGHMRDPELYHARNVMRETYTYTGGWTYAYVWAYVLCDDLCAVCLGWTV